MVNDDDTELSLDRLDFLEFEMNSGSEFGKPCDQDSFEILSTGVLDLGVGRLCGRNTGQVWLSRYDKLMLLNS